MIESENEPSDPSRQSSGQASIDVPPRSGWISPWPSVTPWFILATGVLLAGWLGASPHLFVAMGAACLIAGLLTEK